MVCRNRNWSAAWNRNPAGKRLLWTLLSGLALLLFACQSSEGHLETPVPTTSSLPEAQISPPAPPLLEAVKAGTTAEFRTHPTPTLPAKSEPATSLVYYHAQAGDTLVAVAARFQVRPQDIVCPDPVSPDELLPPGLGLIIPRYSASQMDGELVLPDSEVVFSPSSVDFDIAAYLEQAGGYLSGYKEYLRSTAWTSAADVIARVALENSVNPRLLLALLEYRCGCVFGSLNEGIDQDFIMGAMSPKNKGLYRQLSWVANQLSLGYYGWRSGLFTEFYFSDGATLPVPGSWNAGSAAIAYLYARVYDSQGWRQALDPQEGLLGLHKHMFGDPWQRALSVEPLYPAGLAQPPFILPFLPGQVWSYTSGPHKAWETEGALAALDFAPASAESGCVASDAWIVAVADGLVVRSEHGAVVLDLDGDGYEQTGWTVLYMHVESRDRVAKGAYLKTGELIGHPSCEGGPASGTHLHIARRYNGEWIPAGGALPFVMDGWVVGAGFRPFEGTLTRDRETIIANPYTPSRAMITRSLAALPTDTRDDQYEWREK